MRRARILLSLGERHFNWSRQIHKQITAQFFPTNPKVDETIAVKFLNLPALSKVRLETTLTSPGEKLNFLSTCQYPVDSNGTLDLTTTPCDGPSYLGVDPMGIFWSMDPQPNSLTRLYSSGPLHYSMDLFDMNNQKLFSTSTVRNIYGPEVSRHDVRSNGIVGTLFVPSGSGPFPAIIKLDGAARIKEDLAASLASKGFVVLALAYFRYEGLPKDYSHVKVEYFERAVDYLQGLDIVLEGGVGVLGCSKGCDVALSMATFLPRHKVRAVVTVNGAITSVGGTTSYGDITIRAHMFRLDDFQPKPGPIAGTLDWLGALQPLEEVSDECRIPFEESDADILMIAAEDDHNFESAEWAEAARKNSEKFGKKNFSALIYPGMGHALDAPFAPVAVSIPHILAPKGTRIYMGGANKMVASRRQLESFKTIVQFFLSRLK